jgi:hypothetical protein
VNYYSSQTELAHPNYLRTLDSIKSLFAGTNLNSKKHSLSNFVHFNEA